MSEHDRSQSLVMRKQRNALAGGSRASQIFNRLRHSASDFDVQQANSNHAAFVSRVRAISKVTDGHCWDKSIKADIDKRVEYTITLMSMCGESRKSPFPPSFLRSLQSPAKMLYETPDDMWKLWVRPDIAIYQGGDDDEELASLPSPMFPLSQESTNRESFHQRRFQSSLSLFELAKSKQSHDNPDLVMGNTGEHVDNNEGYWNRAPARYPSQDLLRLHCMRSMPNLTDSSSFSNLHTFASPGTIRPRKSFETIRSFNVCTDDYAEREATSSRFGDATFQEPPDSPSFATPTARTKESQKPFQAKPFDPFQFLREELMSEDCTAYQDEERWLVDVSSAMCSPSSANSTVTVPHAASPLQTSFQAAPFDPFKVLTEMTNDAPTPPLTPRHPSSRGISTPQNEASELKPVHSLPLIEENPKPLPLQEKDYKSPSSPPLFTDVHVPLPSTYASLQPALSDPFTPSSIKHTTRTSPPREAQVQTIKRKRSTSSDVKAIIRSEKKQKIFHLQDLGNYPTISPFVSSAPPTTERKSRYRLLVPSSSSLTNCRAEEGSPLQYATRKTRPANPSASAAASLSSCDYDLPPSITLSDHEFPSSSNQQPLLLDSERAASASTTEMATRKHDEGGMMSAFSPVPRVVLTFEDMDIDLLEPYPDQPSDSTARTNSVPITAENEGGGDCDQSSLAKEIGLGMEESWGWIRGSAESFVRSGSMPGGWVSGWL
ncbi:MAG: hypothetical protein Q9227_003989 [Pyrenula ochraceoflavens]